MSHFVSTITPVDHRLGRPVVLFPSHSEGDWHQDKKAGYVRLLQLAGSQSLCSDHDWLASVFSCHASGIDEFTADPI